MKHSHSEKVTQPFKTSTGLEFSIRPGIVQLRQYCKDGRVRTIIANESEFRKGVETLFKDTK